ncbi:hypothetical protein WICPIJ_004604 [Wickerhamomyces pijperi]|uniref:Serine/threonine-protein phosphatase n=1 Tax=Wickerhamomyces pijperi TaxID=599730 RepID=A0A9P8Q565_WICPI|nr:hypothetical protein WICPIJ_004604 [Wickerhamomyces pijperi]
MGNTPSKSNASPTNQNSNVNSGTTSTTLTGPAEPEPDDRRFPITNKSKKRMEDSKHSNNPASSGLPSTGSGPSPAAKYRQKLQDKIPGSTLTSFHYHSEYNDQEASALDLEISESMARALNIENSANAHSRKSSAYHDKDESYSDVFTYNTSSSSSSSLSNSPENLNKIIPVKAHDYQKNKRRLDINIDSIIERLLTSSTSNPSGMNPSSDAHLPSSSPSSSHSSTSMNNSDFFISQKEIQIICNKSREIFLSQPSLLKLSAPVKVVGDIHGQFNDLLRILKLSGLPPNSNYLFLGDYVDRGKQSLETILLLLCFKIKYPENFFMIRGNHESANISKIYGFYDECKRRLNLKCWKYFIDVFNTLPLAATINEKIFCIHGGLSPNLRSMDQISNIQRPTDIPDEGLLADLLWSDPDKNTLDWGSSDRGVSYLFGAKVVESFSKKFKFDLVIRGHMVVEDGYEFFARKKLVTIFSAPNYCGEFNNWGAVMSVDSKLMCSFELLKPHKKLSSKQY